MTLAHRSISPVMHLIAIIIGAALVYALIHGGFGK